MTKVAKIEVKQDIRAMLIKNAIECTYYVATGDVMAKELSEKYGITLDKAQLILASVANELVEKMKVI